MLSPRDARHAAAVSFSRTIASARLVTTDEVLNEFLTHFSGLGSYWRAQAAVFVRDMQADPLIDVLPQTRQSFEAALTLYEQRLDKDYSLTDCRSMLALRALGLSEVLSNDRHFTQEGFTVVFP